MVHLVTTNKYDENGILVADDEREHVEFLIDYLSKKGFNVSFAETATEAFGLCNKTKFRAYLIDLNIPFGSLESEYVNDTYDNYMGLHIIRAVRSQGNSGARVIAYSAHYNEKIESEIEKLYCKYVVKGSARTLKSSVDELLSTDPLKKTIR